MLSIDPVKTVGICFFHTGFQTEYHIKIDDYRSLDTLAAFLREMQAVVISLENFSTEETQALREADEKCDGAIFASPDCFGSHCLRRGDECRKVCALKQLHPS